mmetsp:Transcript_14952/g.35174  ORF Transcript_14952/g.35174 Transcript_14952/m.35174 type:complete len:225 (-) Transcript_14952:886-1560(-)
MVGERSCDMADVGALDHHLHQQQPVLRRRQLVWSELGAGFVLLDHPQHRRVLVLLELHLEVVHHLHVDSQIRPQDELDHNLAELLCVLFVQPGEDVVRSVAVGSCLPNDLEGRCHVVVLEHVAVVVPHAQFAVRRHLIAVVRAWMISIVDNRGEKQRERLQRSEILAHATLIEHEVATLQNVCCVPAVVIRIFLIRSLDFCQRSSSGFKIKLKLGWELVHFEQK